MHLAFCFPYNNPPREDVFNRFGKDLSRFRLFQKFYPITDASVFARPPALPATGADDGAGGPAGVVKGGRPPVKAEVDLDRVLLHGFAAYGLIRGALDELLRAIREIPAAAERMAQTTVTAPRLDVKTGPGTQKGWTLVEFTPPTGAKAYNQLLVVSPWPREVVASLAAARADPADSAVPTVTQYAPYMDVCPESFLIGGASPICLYSTHNHLIAATCLAAGGAGVVTPQYLLMYFLFQAHRTKGRVRDMFIRYYRAVLEVICVGGEAIRALRSTDRGTVPEDIYRRFVESSPFGLPVSTFGDANYSESYLIRLGQSVQAVGIKPRGDLASDLPNMKGLPSNYYRSGPRSPEKKHPPFDYECNSAFEQDGRELGVARGPGEVSRLFEPKTEVANPSGALGVTGGWIGLEEFC